MRVTSSVPASAAAFERPAASSASSASHTAEPERREARPAVRLVATFVVAYAVLTAACIGLGLFLTDASATAGLRRWDVSVNRWFVHQRTGTLDSLTAVGSHLAETPTVVGLGLIVVALVWWRRRDLYAVGILVVGLTLEVTVFVSTTLFVDRARPPVHHLDAAPPTSSFPSGHTAAAVAIVFALVPVAVGLSRLYRGMHHPTDVFAGALLGAIALTIACIAVRAAIVRSGRPDPVGAHAREVSA